MKQVLQNLRDGATLLETIPVPVPGGGEVLIRTACSLVSAGTEKMLLDFGKASLIDKARSQPDKVKMVLDKLRSDGVVSTVAAVQKKLSEPIPLGYCNVGRVVEVGSRVRKFAVGDWVVSNGAHAEYVCVGENLCARLPLSSTKPQSDCDAQIDIEQAAFTVLGAIALQGIRLANPTLGETVVVYGLGLIGQIAARLLRANGCRVIGFDTNESRVMLAAQQGVDAYTLAPGCDAVAIAQAKTAGIGVDAVLVTASTSSDELMHHAAQMSRKRGRIVLVGVTGLALRRDDFYQKELSFQVSCSYGPGRYDADYEIRGQDYPISFVRWTEQRNFEAIIDLLHRGLLDVSDLITHRFDLAQAVDAYEALGAGKAMGIVLRYPQPDGDEHAEPAAISPLQRRIDLTTSTASSSAASSSNTVAGGGKGTGIGFIGAGNYASAQLLPAFRKSGAKLAAIVSQKGVSAVRLGRQYGIATALSNVDDVFNDDTIGSLVITTRHDTHASLVLRALAAGKHVFVEKPLCLTGEELDAIDAAMHANEFRTQLMVGFNRRFAPLVIQMQSRLAKLHGPRQINMLVNALAIDSSHWTQDISTGGGRIIGEACHFIDLARFLAGAPIVDTKIMAGASGAKISDNCVIALRFANGSVASIAYFSGGHRAVAKENISVFCEGKVLQLDNYRVLSGAGWSDLKKIRHFRQDKGQQACINAFVKAISSDSAKQGSASAPIDYRDIYEVMACTLRASALAELGS